MINLISLIFGIGGQELLVIFLVLFVALFPISGLLKKSDVLKIRNFKPKMYMNTSR